MTARPSPLKCLAKSLISWCLLLELLQNSSWEWRTFTFSLNKHRQMVGCMVHILRVRNPWLSSIYIHQILFIKYCLTDFILKIHICYIRLWLPETSIQIKILDVAKLHHQWSHDPPKEYFYSLLVVSASISISVSFNFLFFPLWCDCFIFKTSANTDFLGCLMKWSLNDDVGYGVNSKPKYFVLLPDLSISTIRRTNNIVRSIKTKLLSTSTPFVKSSCVMLFLLQLLGGCLLTFVMYVQLIWHCHSWFHCDLSQSNQLRNFLTQSLLYRMDQTFQISCRKTSNLQSVQSYIEMCQPLRPAR